MHDLAYLHDKKFAAILVADDGTEDGEWIVLAGIAKWRRGRLTVDRGTDIPEFPVPEAAFSRIQPVAADVRDILEGADYSVTLAVGPIPEGVDASTLDYTGFTWPDKTE